jgi:peptide/nickel transport system permease protein
LERGLAAFITRRLIQTIVVLIIVTFLCFLLIHLIPGDPVRMMLGPFATADEVGRVTSEMGLDQPFLTQYVHWIADASHGDFGQSIRYMIPVVELFKQRFPVTLLLAFFALIISVVFGISTGIISAIRRGTFLDQSLVILATTGVCVPIFWLGIIGIYIFGLDLHWLPIQGFIMPNVNLIQSLRYAIMPVILLAIPSLAVMARQTRSSMLEVVQQDFIRTAWSKGLRERSVILKHAVKNALVPIVTLIGIQLRILLGGSVLVETVFNIPGMGRLLVDAALNKDYFVVQGEVLMFGIIVCLANLLVDISYGWLDPRVRYG